MPSPRSSFTASVPRRLPAGALAALALSALTAWPAAAQEERPARVSPVVPKTAPGASGSESGPQGADRRALHAHALRYRPAEEALELVRPLLSPLGTVELQPGNNTLVVRDSVAALSRIVPALRRFDRPGEPIEIEILLVRARAATDPPSRSAPLPPDLERSLRALLRYERYELVAEARVQGREYQDVTYELGGDYAVRFRVGSVSEGERLRLSGFQVERTAAGDGEPQPLIHTHLNVRLGRPLTLGLARSEASDSALMVAITCRRGAAPVPAAPVAAKAGDGS